MTEDHAQEIADAWLQAWNRHDLEAILQHYAEDVTFTSPLVAKLGKAPAGTLHGKVALRDYFGAALKAYPELKFEMRQVLAGVDSLVLYYRSISNLLVAEMMQFGPDGLVTRVMAHYTREV